ncbi:hypothetical protein ASO20_01730 [Mycoplasma sp. (ex Biomphalaria glabrata)]|uniref:cysteine--tRNA ligase n=1 Tax=Mycoplasma sp. (ex Biomphalaria glabrata) TaxID=1749074 RepID=UPI00073A922F|nr:cysteine--tRNA ligase [Mycoplasma sp. (ex Biomphalaria glabrata)]ALV23368.1 hypothetical protein ASO20_01730 [Mycoplasma sp. (ex Biomphalaria glabrata)]
MKIFNNLTKQLEEFKTINHNQVLMYVCGPTTYDYIHIGNARCFLTFDIIYRYLEFSGYEVLYLQNITDIDDKIINRAIKNKKEELELSNFFYQEFIKDCENLNIKKPWKTIKVSDEINAIKEFINKLISNNSAYISDSNVYFDTSKIQNYGVLSKRILEENLENSREIIQSKKHNASDFILWKQTNEGVNWDFNGIQGRPGWHTECVTLIKKYLGPRIDIHGGGIDLTFPHHENEIAQSCALGDDFLANYWIHNGQLSLNNEKMSKSLGNIISVHEFNNKYDDNLLRWIFMQKRYAQPLEISDSVIEESNKQLHKIYDAIEKSLINYINTSQSNELFMRKFSEQMDNNFNTANVVTILLEIVKKINILTRDKNVNKNEISVLLNTFFKIFSVLGFKMKQNWNKIEIN